MGNRVVLSPEGNVLVTSPGTDSSYPHPPKPLKYSFLLCNTFVFLRFSQEFKAGFRLLARENAKEYDLVLSNIRGGGVAARIILTILFVGMSVRVYVCVFVCFL